MPVDVRDVVRDERLWRRVGLGLGLGRVVLGAGFWLAPSTSVRVAGFARDLAPTADWLARMTAGRDIAIGAGTTAAVLRAGSTPPERAAWYLAGAVADLGDTLSIRRGIREGRLGRLPAVMASSGAAVAVVVGAVAAGRELFLAEGATAGPKPTEAPYSKSS